MVRLTVFFCVTFALIASASAQRRIRVNIESTPPGATVFLDAAEGAGIGTTPLRRVRVPAGEHTLIFRLDRHREVRLPVRLRRWNETFRATLDPLAILDLRAGNEGAEGAEARIDGEPKGPLPWRGEVEPGRHLVQVERDGFSTFSQWVQVDGAQVLTLPVMLQAEAPDTGSLLVAGDVSGAEVRIDGELRGQTPAVIDGLSVGSHQVQVVGSEAGLQPFTQEVRILAGERTTVAFRLRPEAPETGRVRVLVRPSSASAVVSLDGELLGEAPADAEAAPGEHILEVRAEGFEPAQRTVSVVAGQQQVMAIELTPVARAPGRISIRVPGVEGATVLINGEERGAPPVVIDAPPAGTHAIVVRAPGRAEYRTTCETAPEQNCEVIAELDSAPSPVQVVANVPGELFLDGERIGPVPFEGELPSGSHTLEVRAEGYRVHREQVALVAQAERRRFDITLAEEGALTPEEAAEERRRREHLHRDTVARSGAPIPDDLAIVDFSLGWPYLFEGRMGVGILPWLDAGVGLRTFGRLTEFEGRAKAGYRPVPQFSIGAQVRFGGGLGPRRGKTDIDRMQEEVDDSYDADHPTSSFFTSLEAMASLHFQRAGNFTLWAAVDFHSDSWDWRGDDRNCQFAGGCEADGSATRMGATPIDGRQNIARFRVGGSLEFIVSERWNVWTSFEGAFGSDRRVLGDVFRAGRSDTQLYTRAGLTYKFDVLGDATLTNR